MKPKQYRKPTEQNAIRAIDQHGLLLVFPILNAKDPHSLWFEFHPRTKMRWEWDENGDDKVGQLWGLMKRLSENRKVVYTKWYQGRATFFSRALFVAMLAMQRKQQDHRSQLSRAAQNLLEILESDSPLSTKQLKKAADLQGKDNEGTYNRALKELFTTLWIVAFGEVDDGAFPSLAVGATRLIFEDLWREAELLSNDEAQATVDRLIHAGSKARRYFEKNFTSQTKLPKDSRSDRKTRTVGPLEKKRSLF